jgi:hypothetical protein
MKDMIENGFYVRIGTGKSAINNYFLVRLPKEK